MIICNRCGKDNQDHYKFCLGCGADIAPAPKPAAGDVGMMKTMMADTRGGPPLGSVPIGAAQPAPIAVPQQRPPTAQPVARPPTPIVTPAYPAVDPTMPPPGPLGAPPPMGPPPGVPGFSPGYAAPAAIAAPSAMIANAMKRCPSCGTDVPPGFRFCGSCGYRMEETSAVAAAMPATIAPVMRAAPRHLLTLIRPDGSEGGAHELKAGVNHVGRDHGIMFENDGYLSPLHAELIVNGPQSLVRDLGSLNGVFVKMTSEEELQPGQIIRIGQELLRFELVAAPEPTADGTEVMGSPNPGFWGRLVVIIGYGIDGPAFPLLGDTATIGRDRGDINFPDDGYVSGLHARISLRGGRVFIIDLGSSNGSFMKVNGERAVGNDSFVLLGQQLFRLNMA